MDVLNEVENGNRKMLCYPVMSVELRVLLGNQNTGIRLPAQFLTFSNQAHLQVQTFFMYFINHKTLLIRQGLSAASVWEISQLSAITGTWLFLLQVLSELSAPADISEPSSQKLTVSHSHYWKRHCQVQQLCHRPQIIHPGTPRVRHGLFTSMGENQPANSPILCHQSAMWECHIPASYSFLLSALNAVESPSSCPGTPAHGVKALQCNNAVSSQHNSTPTATNPEKNIKNWAGNYSSTTPNLPAPLPMNLPFLTPYIQQALFWWTHWDQPPPSCPTQLTFYKPLNEESCPGVRPEWAERQNRRVAVSSQVFSLISDLLPKLP